jgi:L-seryl-tRNA(Ser) seleniumtransferase
VTDPRRSLPSVDRLLEHPVAAERIRSRGRAPVVDALRRALEAARTTLATQAGEGRGPGVEELLTAAWAELDSRSRPSLRRVLNGTGVVLHTNLGRSPLSATAAAAVLEIAVGYSNLEYDLDRGQRGDRFAHCVSLLCDLTGAEAAMVVNNNAAAVALVINELAAGREVVVSRGELVEIGGSFRLPDVVMRSGGRLREVGTTNRTRAADVRAAIGPDTGILLKVHPSNYKQEGFVSEVGLHELVSIGRETGVPVVHDLGSGLLLPSALPGFPPEPSPADSVREGADVVTWSGDKLLGGPQAGIIHGSAELMARLRANPLSRAVRVDKLGLAALEVTLRAYTDPETAVTHVPVLTMLTEPAAAVRARAEAALEHVAAAVRHAVGVRSLDSLVGGGAYPGWSIDSAGWAVDGSASRLDAALRAHSPPLIGRSEEGAFLVDFRTILPGTESEVAAAVSTILEGTSA